MDGAQLVLEKRGKGCGGRLVGQVSNQDVGSALGVVDKGLLGHGANVWGELAVLAMRLAAVDCT